jgi:prepilin-type N-terminal cleavage/methylation domain-containing protein/prepilin-type processing-associated H-X9-DG protein
MGQWRRAFTLAELMIVIAIIGVLLALMVPGFGEAWAVANHTRCTDNLHRLYQAISMRNADEMVNVRLTSLRATVWPAQLMPYLERGAEIMVCPNGGESMSEGGGGGGGTGGDTPPGGGGGDPGGSGGDPPIPDYPPRYAQLSDLAEVKNVAGSSTYFTPLEEGRWMLKLSDEQYSAATAQNLLNDSANADNIRTKFNCNYSPGGNPHSYWLCDEDHGADEDYKDLMIHVTEERDGSFTLDIVGGFTGHTNSIVSKPDGAQLISVPSHATGLRITLKPTDEELPPGGSGGDPGGTGGTGGQRPGEQDAIPNVVVATSYAMNANYPRMPRKGGKILLMDYCHYLAYVTDDWRGEKMDPDGDSIPTFARHWGRMNVLYADGSVKLEDARDVDPVVPTTEMLLWDP